MKGEIGASPTENTSGQGKLAVIPEEIQGWNWGAFLLNWIWGIGNKAWIALLALIPVPLVGFVMAIVLGVKGNEWAWRNKRWESIEHFRRTQRTWAIWGIAPVVILLGVGVFYFLGMRAVNQATEAMLEDRLVTARLVADYLDEALVRSLIELEKTAQAIEIDGASSNLEAQIEALEDAYSRLSIHTDGIYLLNEQGQIIWSKPEAPAVEGVDISFHPSVARSLRNSEATISGLVSAPVTDTPVVFLASPTGEGRQGGKGVLIVAIDIAQSSIGGFVQPIILGQTGYVEVVDQNGTVIARTEPGPKLAPFEKSDHSGRFAALIAAGEPTLGVCHTCHETEQEVQRKDVLAFIPLSEAPWGVVIRQSEEEALAPTHELRQSLLLFGVGLITIALVFVVITTLLNVRRQE